MLKTLVALLATLALTLAHAVPVRAQDLSPAQALPTCAGVYATLAVYASPQYQPQLKARSMQIMDIALNYNPNAAKIALKLLENNIARVRANDPTVADEVGGAEKYCRQYITRFGL